MKKNTTINLQNGQILADSLEYIKKYNGKYIVIKFGGDILNNKSLRDSLVKDILLLHLIGLKIIIVHGGGTKITEKLECFGVKSKFINGMRVTDEVTLEVAEMVLLGKINKEVVASLSFNGGNAIGISGVDCNFIKVHQLNKKLGLVGEIENINIDFLKNLIDKKMIPVISPIGIDSKGVTYNINADVVATKIASSIKAEGLIFMSNVNGVMKDKNDDFSTIKKITEKDVKILKKEKIIDKGMIPKIDSCIEATKNGCKKVFIINGKIKHSVLIELLTNEGLGTMLV